jgi:hypothetical protein
MSHHAVRIEGGRLHIGLRFSVSFQCARRSAAPTLPLSLGALPLHIATDYPGRAPESWDGDVFLPLSAEDALWLGFSAARWKPNAVKVAAGEVNAVSGKRWDEALHDDPQDYLVCPPQLWLDGVYTGPGQVRQFTAASLVETGLEHDKPTGLTLLVFEPLPGRFPDSPPPRAPRPDIQHALLSGDDAGEISQEILVDPFGLETWDPGARKRVAIHCVGPERYEAITGHRAPDPPSPAEVYTKYRLP